MPVVRWGVFKNYQPVFIAKEKGFFEDEGINVEFSGSFTSGPAVIQAAASDQIDAGHSAVTGIINAVNAGIMIRGVADSQTEFKDAPLMKWYVLSDSGIGVATDLKGKRIGINSLSGSFYYTALIYLERNGLSKEDVQFVIMPHNNQEQALYSRQIDVAGLIDPYTAHIEQTGGARVLYRAVDILGENQFSLIFFTRDFLDNSPEVVRRFFRAYKKAIAFISSNPKEASSVMANQVGVSTNLVGIHRFTHNAEVKLDDVQFWIDMMRKHGELIDNGKLTVRDVATNEFSN